MRANDQRLCLRCGGVMRPGKAILNTCTGIPDFPGQEIVTLSPGGPGIMVDCLKCCQCGQSRFPGDGDTPHCPQHGTMQKAHPATPEQKWCGEWWRCDRCTHTVLRPSDELRSGKE